MKAFVTGGAGFIGGSMSSRLLLGPANTVTIYDNLMMGQSRLSADHSREPRLKVIRADLLDFDTLNESIKGHEIVFHFAGNSDISRGVKEPRLDFDGSLVATYNLLESMRSNGVKQLVFASGSGVYGDVKGEETREDFGPLLPVSMYGAGKLGAEALVSAYAHRFGIQSYIFRMANVVGGKQTHGVIYDFISRLRADPSHLVVFGDGKQRKSYIHIDDVLNAIFFVVTMADELVNVFNLATIDQVEVSWIVSVVLELMGLTDVTQVEYGGGDRGWPGDVPVVRLNTEKIAKLGWRAKYNSQESVRLSVKEMLEFQTQTSAGEGPK